jgi:hypothetical protein
MLFQPFLMNPRNKCVEIDQVFCSAAPNWFGSIWTYIVKPTTPFIFNGLFGLKQQRLIFILHIYFHIWAQLNLICI